MSVNSASQDAYTDPWYEPEDDEEWHGDQTDQSSICTDDLVNSLDSHDLLDHPPGFPTNRTSRTSRTSPTSPTSPTDPTDPTGTDVQTGVVSLPIRPVGLPRGARKRFSEKLLKLRGIALLGDSMGVKRRLRRRKCKAAWQASMLRQARRARYLAEAALHR